MLLLAYSFDSVAVIITIQKSFWQSRQSECSSHWARSELSIKMKLDPVTSCVFLWLLYAVESWTLKVTDKKRLLAFEIRLTILKIP